MNNRFEISLDFTIAPERTVWNIKTVAAPVYSLSPERAAFIAAILSGTRPELAISLPSTDRPSRTPGEPTCHKG
jgi:hypothetical protein